MHLGSDSNRIWRMSGNRKRARLASLESQLKAQPINSTPNGDSWQETEFQSQPSYSVGTGHWAYGLPTTQVECHQPL
jgi:hypothetical protein